MHSRHQQQTSLKQNLPAVNSASDYSLFVYLVVHESPQLPFSRSLGPNLQIPVVDADERLGRMQAAAHGGLYRWRKL